MLDISGDKNDIKQHSYSLNTSWSDDEQLLQSVLKFEMEHDTEWISNAIENDKGTVLAHCEQAVSRSPKIIIAYLLSYSKNDLEQFTVVNEAL
ncbi:unnamed protein product, partial [Didymodactylos carnosus]